jgi:PAS domain S-box-containing protein
MRITWRWDFKALDFRTQLTLATAATCAIALIVAASLLLSREIVTSRRDTEADLRSLADLVGENSASALVLGNAPEARRKLELLAARRTVLAARLYLEEGTPLADYRAAGASWPLPDHPGRPQLRIEDGQYVLFHPVLLRGEHVGDLYLLGSREQMLAHIYGYGLTILVVLLVATAAASLFAVRLHGLLSRPIGALTAAAGRVYEHGDYTVRVPELRSGELATLTSAFNRMLQQIQAQDAILRAHHADLEGNVRDRVRELRQEVQERRAAEAALRTSQAELKSVVDNSTNLFYSHTPQDKVAYVSPQTLAFLDCAPEEAPPRWSDWLTDDPVNRQGLAARARAIETGQRQPSYEMELRTAKGRRVRVEVNEAPVVQNGRCVLVVGALCDITERKRIEVEKSRLEEQLRQAQKMEAVGRLAGGVAHDFNNLLGVISGYGELLLRQLALDSPYRKRVEQILKATDRATGLTRQLLTFSRKHDVDPKPLDLSPVVGEMEKMLEHMIGEDVRLSLEIQKPLGIVRADPGQIEQVLMNLAVNARDAMPRGGALQIALRNREVSAADGSSIAAGGYVVLEVADSGTGMDPETLSHVFEPFFTTKENGRGTGLGLATVYGIVQQSGGRITVDSRPDAGTTFRIFLPRVDEPAQRAAEKPAFAIGGRETILLVEDEAALRDLVAEMLRDAGYQVLPASGGADALTKVQAHRAPIDILLTDIVMPGLGGPELSQRIHALRPAIRTLYMSGYTEDVLARRGLIEPGTPLVQKPFTAATLLRSVREELAAVPVCAEQPPAMEMEARQTA